jgi:uncharacterized protein (TIGR02118 family)
VYKLVSFARFRADLDRADAARHWREIHGPLGASVPGLLRYEQNHFVGSAPLHEGAAPPPPLDGYASLWFADRDAFQTATATDQWQALADDGGRLFDLEATMSAAVEERVIVAGEHTPYKVVAVANFRSDMERAAASDYWTKVHGPLGVRAAPGFTCYVQNHVLADDRGAPSSTGLTFDGFAEHWLVDRDSYVATVESPEWKEVHDDGFEVFQMDNLWESEVLEVVIKD